MVTGQKIKTKSTPCQLIRPGLLSRILCKGKSSVKASTEPPAIPGGLTSELPVTTLRQSGLVTSKSGLVTSKSVSRHPVMRSAECSYRVKHEYSAARGTSFEVCSQRHYPRVNQSPLVQSLYELLVRFAANRKRMNHAARCRKISNRITRAATKNKFGMMAGRPGIHRDQADNSPPIFAIPHYSGLPCPQTAPEQKH